MKKRIIGIIIVVFLVAVAIVAYSNIQPSATKEDIAVEAILQINRPSTAHNNAFA